MPSQLIQRIFIEEGYYHIFNRGNAKANIFRTRADYVFFLTILANYLSPQMQNQTRKLKNYHQKITLLAFCLMPNHFHFCLQQHGERHIASFIHSLTIRYNYYFNKKYGRVGHVFQGTYKARLISSDEDLLNLTRYIHRNPFGVKRGISDYPFSSFAFYRNAHNTPRWINVDHILEIFSGKKVSPQQRRQYEAFVLRQD